MSALTAFKNAMGKLTQSRHGLGQVHGDLAFWTTKRDRFLRRRTLVRPGLAFGHVSPLDAAVTGPMINDPYTGACS